METFTGILSEINNLPSRMKPTDSRKHNIVHGDGLTQTHIEEIMPENVFEIRKDIWNNKKLNLEQKQQLNEALVAHFPI